MASIMSSKVFRVCSVGSRLFSAGPGKSPQAKPSPAVKVTPVKESTKPPKAAPQAAPPVGPGASKEGPYKNPEYYQYNPMSFYDIEKEMMSYRLTQPSSKKQ